MLGIFSNMLKTASRTDQREKHPYTHDAMLLDHHLRKGKELRTRIQHEKRFHQ